MENKQTAVEWLIYALTDNPNPYLFLFEKPDYMEGLINIIQQAKQMEADKEFETKQYWFGRGVLAGKEDRISELKPKRNHG